jgi:hypothetical protein
MNWISVKENVMLRRHIAVAAALLIVVCMGVAMAQTQTSSGSRVVPSLVNFSGTLTDINGKPLTSIVGVTFSLYKDEQAASPLWLETQNVTADKYGHYTVQLGATSSTGLPADIFVAGEARWLGVQPQGQAEYPRVVLLSVPYALKAEDAQTLGGLPASAFMLAVPASSGVTAAAPLATSSSPMSSATSSATSNVTTTGGTVNTIPLFTTATNIQNSAITQTGTGTTAKIGIGTTTPASTLDVKGGVTIRGLLSLPATGTATAAGGKISQPIDLVASAFNSGTSTAVNQTFQWQAEPAANNTVNPSGTLNLLYGLGATKPSETGLHIASDGQISFATGQTFPGTGTVSSVGSGAGLTGGPITGSGSLSIATGGVSNAMLANSSLTISPGTGLLGGGPVSLGGSATLNLDTTKVPLLAAANTFTGNQTVNGNLSATGTITGNAFNIGFNLFAFGSFNNSNAFLGFAGNTSMTGGGNTATGYLAFVSNTMGLYNTANGYGALIANTTGGNNTAIGDSALADNMSGVYNTGVGDSALYYNTAGNFNTSLGGQAGFTFDGSYMTGSNNTFVGANTTTATGTLTNATAIGANAMVTASNAMVLGSINGVDGATASTNVGIGTTAPMSQLEVDGQSQNVPAAISGIGFSAPLNSGLPATAGIVAQGGNGDQDSNLYDAGTGILAYGGSGYSAGDGIIGLGGGASVGFDGTGGYFVGGNTSGLIGDGIDAIAGSGLAGYFSGEGR